MRIRFPSPPIRDFLRALGASAVGSFTFTPTIRLIVDPLSFNAGATTASSGSGGGTGGGGSTDTFQAVLDAQGTKPLNKDNTIDSGGNNFNIGNLRTSYIEAVYNNFESDASIAIQAGSILDTRVKLIAENTGNTMVLNLTPTALTINKNGTGAKEIATVNYLVYTALLNQTGTNAPVPTIKENTLTQNITWSRVQLGIYFGAFDTDIPIDKIFIPNGSSFLGNNAIMIPVGDFTLRGYIIINLNQTGVNAQGIALNIVDASFANVELSILMTNTKIPIEIRVYP